VENTSFSIGLVSLDQMDKAIPAWEYHHLAPSNTDGTKVLTRDSQYLLGSISLRHLASQLADIPPNCKYMHESIP
jgi:hypothetical protein